MNDQRPEMPALEVGLKLTAKFDKRTPDQEVEVVKVGRKWGTAKPLGGSQWTEFRFDLKTGWVDGGNYRSPGRVYTRAQLNFDARKSAAEAWLKENLARNIFDLRPRWRDNTLELANLLRRHEGLEEL